MNSCIVLHKMKMAKYVNVRNVVYGISLINVINVKSFVLIVVGRIKDILLSILNIREISQGREGRRNVKVLIACEFSGIVRDAFEDRGHDAWSCDLLPTESEQTKSSGKHIQGDVLEILFDGWDLMIAHPPCTHLAVSGARWFKDKQQEQTNALLFVRRLLDSLIPKIALENPISVISSHIRKPDQIIQPWQYGHGETKATCLWLKNLPKLTPTNIVDGREARVHKMPPSADRWKLRSTTFQGIADAMAAQWG